MDLLRFISCRALDEISLRPSVVQYILLQTTVIYSRADTLCAETSSMIISEATEFIGELTLEALRKANSRNLREPYCHDPDT